MQEKNENDGRILTGFPSIDRPWEPWYPPKVLSKTLPEMIIYEYIKKNNMDHLDRVALNYYGRKITYAQLFYNIEKTAKILQKKGVKRGDIITVATPTLPETIYLFYAVSMLGAIVNMIDPRTSAKGIEEYVNEVKSDFLFIVDVALPKVNNLESNDLKEIISISPADSLPLGLNLGYRGKEFFQSMKLHQEKPKPKQRLTKWNSFFQTVKQDNFICESYQKDQPVAVVHTGGTTGKPKGVLLSNDNLNSASFQCEIAGFDFKREHRWLNIMPPFIVYGIGNGLHLPLSIGMEVILIPQFNPKEFDKLLVKYRPEHMTGVPDHYAELVNSTNKKFIRDNLEYMIAPTIGGYRINPALEEKTNQFLFDHGCKYKIVKGYGLSEVSAAVAACISNETNEIGSVGIPLPHTVISIFDPDTGQELRYGEWGEVCISGPNTMLSYYQNEVETNHIMRRHDDGKLWIHSGDIGYMTEKGFLYIIDRMKRMIIRHDGFKVFPSMIEDVIMSHPMIQNCNVTGIDDPDHVQGQLPVVDLKLKESALCFSEMIIEELRVYCSERLPEYCQPIDYIVTDQLEQTSIGKIKVKSHS